MLEYSDLKASDIMTREIISVQPDTSVRWVATLMARNHVSALPVVDETGCPIGMISEGDLIKWSDEPYERQSWWLNMLADDYELSPAYLDSVLSERESVRHLMHSPIISVAEDTPVSQIAAVLATHHIKRVVVLRETKLVGLVSRGDLVRAMAGKINHPSTD